MIVMKQWHSKSLGDGMWADIPSEEIKQLFQPLFESAGSPADMAIFVRHEPGPLHCGVTAYFSPAAAAVASAVGAELCAPPARQGLELLAGTEDSWSALFLMSAPRQL